LSKTLPRRKRASLEKDRRALIDEPPEEGGRDEAAAFIGETLGPLLRLARRHQLDLLLHLLAMAQLEAEEHVRLRSKRKLS
jgi:hypothetical protein